MRRFDKREISEKRMSSRGGRSAPRTSKTGNRYRDTDSVYVKLDGTMWFRDCIAISGPSARSASLGMTPNSFLGPRNDQRNFTFWRVSLIVGEKVSWCPAPEFFKLLG